ncbi:MAG: cell division protein [Rhodospirillales bacterium]|jgi:cell division transport system permease protein|nr:cell division protein [Rhodospirillaceae bacterium]MDP6429819.1 cell division protein [Rhodospirillales bacterium]MDP6645127.1 cell division protein [Rhodospirillales bacterium]MDP6841243.1 cell division protein [Rhodospirillales bacterium]|tara:strand:+ start:38 stop:919 length:882 start_codon:yes stop_codon:yes gene_type:complete
MAIGRSDIQFGGDDASRFLPWMLAFMVYLAALAVAGLFILDDVTRKIDRGIENTLTIQIPASDDILTDDRKVAAVLSRLRRMRGVERADALDAEQVAALLRPWLGETAGSDQLPMPRVIDVNVDRGDGFQAEFVRDALEPIVPEIIIDDHGAWLQDFLRAVRATELIAVAVVLLICVITVITVIFTTRTGLGLHRETIEIMHFVGARDSYVARQFAIRFSLMGIKGALIGIAIAVPTLLLLSVIAENSGIGLIPRFHLSVYGWSGIGALVPASAVIAMITARATVMKSLTQMV